MNPSIFPILLAANKYRIVDFDFPQLLGLPAMPLIILGLIVLSVVLGILIANAARMRDYGWKIGLILSTLLVSTFGVLFGDFKLGVDLKGGVILVYEVDEIETAQLHRNQGEGWSMNQLLTVITRRLNKTGLEEIVVRPFGPKHVEIVVPEADPEAIRSIKRELETAGVLQFMIVASDERDAELFDAAKQQAANAETRRLRSVIDPETRGQEKQSQIGYWAKLVREAGETSPFRALETIFNGYIRDGRTGEIIELTPQQKQLFANSQSQFEAYLKDRGTSAVDVLMAFDDVYSIQGEDLNAGLTYAGYDQRFRPAIHFAMRTEGSAKMGYITQENIQRKLAIIFDGELLSAPVINSKITDNGIIEGNFEQKEVDFIVGILKSGSMPAVMQKTPISENQIGAILGYDTIVKGSYSVLFALSLILVFLVFYYRFAGMVAAFALTLNLLLTIAIMVFLKAPFTLPGLAGLVLTVAMSVDANVLISERMREELERGATLRMAIRNGFDKALSAIIDGNLTTFFTAIVLYKIGTDQVKGFGMTLMLGNITSMFTAIFCARVILDVAERTRFIKTLSMGKFLSTPNVDWVRFFVPATIGSLVLIMLGIGVTVARGKGLFDIDLAGGTSVAFILKQPMPETEVRTRLDKLFEDMHDPATNTRVDHNVYGMQVETEQPGTVYKVDSSLEDIALLQEKVREALRGADGQDGLKTFAMSIGELTESTADKPPAAPILTAPSAGQAEPKLPATRAADKAPPTETKKADSPPPAQPKTDQPKTDEKASEPKTTEEQASTEKKEPSGCDAEEQEPAEKAQDAKAQPPETAKTDEPKTDTAKTETTKSEPTIFAPANTQPAATPPESAAPTIGSKLQTTATLRFPGSPISADALKKRLSESAITVLAKDLTITLDNPKWNQQDNVAFAEWKVTLPVDKDQAAKVFDHAKSKLESDIVWQTSSKIGGQVSADTRLRALGALIASLIGIVAYVWFRFQKVAWGLAAVAAIAHDALVMLAGIAASYWLAPYLGFLGVEEFKISLPVVAAFLTILGYSVNDTIVIFDRLREIRGKSPEITRSMLNAAVNQTLGRTIILAGITITVTLILYIFGGPGIHAFAFALVIGVASGLYTTLVIAAPMLLWLLSRKSPTAMAKIEQPRDVKKSVA